MLLCKRLDVEGPPAGLGDPVDPGAGSFGRSGAGRLHQLHELGLGLLLEGLGLGEDLLRVPEPLDGGGPFLAFDRDDLLLRVGDLDGLCLGQGAGPIGRIKLLGLDKVPELGALLVNQVDELLVPGDVEVDHFPKLGIEHGEGAPLVAGDVHLMLQLDEVVVGQALTPALREGPEARAFDLEGADALVLADDPAVEMREHPFKILVADRLIRSPELSAGALLVELRGDGLEDFPAFHGRALLGLRPAALLDFEKILGPDPGRYAQDGRHIRGPQAAFPGFMVDEILLHGSLLLKERGLFRAMEMVDPVLRTTAAERLLQDAQALIADFGPDLGDPGRVV